MSVATATTHATNPSVSGQQAFATRLDTVLDRPDIRGKLEQFVADAHAELIGAAAKPATLDQSTVRTLAAAAVPTLSAKDLASIHAVSFQVPHVGVLATSRTTLANRFWLYFVGAVVLIALAIATSRDRRSSLKLIGAWLLGISVVHLVVLWIVPVVIVPKVSHNPWANLVASVARALSAGIVTGLVVLAAAGVGFLLADHLVAPAPAPATLPPGRMPES